MKPEKDLGARQRHHYYFRNGTMDFYAGWLLGYSQVGGLSPGSLYDCLNRVKDGDPGSWVRAFEEAAAYQDGEARAAEARGSGSIAAQHHLAATTAARAALNLCRVRTPEAVALADRMEASFQAAMRAGATPIEPCEVPFEGRRLPGYASTGAPSARTLVVVVGGGDTYREDLWFFGGAAALTRGYPVLMVDLPGQGRTPSLGLHFGRATLEALDAVVRWGRARWPDHRVVLCGWSGGGYFTTKYVDLFGGVDAWIASTPIEDLAKMFEEAMPAVLRGHPEGWAQRALLRIAGRLSPVLDVSLEKYSHQFGPGGIAGAVELMRTVGRVEVDRLDAPLLALVGTSEAAEAQAQARHVYEAVHRRHATTALVEFSPASGGDAHCQVNNFPLAFEHIFGWLDRIGLAAS